MITKAYEIVDKNIPFLSTEAMKNLRNQNLINSIGQKIFVNCLIKKTPSGRMKALMKSFLKLIRKASTELIIFKSKTF